jgi:hypothetical protein
MHSLAASPVWTEHFYSEVGEIQPPILSADFQTPFDLYAHVRELFALSFAYSTSHPWLRSYPPLQALQHLASYSGRLPQEPFIAKLEKPLPIAISCQVALLWALNGYATEASELAAALEPLIRCEFTSLWTTEREYNEGEARLSFALLLLALGKVEEANRLYHPSLPKDRFFAWLFEKNVKIEAISSESADYDLIEGDHCTYAITVHQNKVQSGSLRSGSVLIPAFGPHSAPLSNSNLFGMKQVVSNEGWFSSTASKDAWFQLTPLHIDSFALQCIGVEPENPVYFVFYVQANDCMIDGRQFKPKSLLRFSGQMDVVQFQQGLDKLQIMTDRPISVELIPLSGGDTFWGATFLLAYRVPSVMGRIIFQMKKN